MIPCATRSPALIMVDKTAGRNVAKLALQKPEDAATHGRTGSASVAGRPSLRSVSMDERRKAETEALKEGLVFVIDDDADVLTALGSLLRAVGYDVCGRSGVEGFAETGLPERPCCLLLDIHLRGSSGLDFQRSLTERRVAIPGVKLCIDCQNERDGTYQTRGGINRRGSKEVNGTAGSSPSSAKNDCHSTGTEFGLSR